MPERRTLNVAQVGVGLWGTSWAELVARARGFRLAGVVDAGAAAELAHRVAEPGLDERVDHHRRTAAGLRDGQHEVVRRLDPRVPHDLELLAGELRLQREHEPRGSLPGRVGDHVDLERLAQRLQEFEPQRLGAS